MTLREREREDFDFWASVRGKTKTFLIGKELKTKDLRHTAARTGKRTDNKIQPKTRIKPPDSLRREASQAAGAAPTLRYGPVEANDAPASLPARHPSTVLKVWSGMVSRKRLLRGKIGTVAMGRSHGHTAVTNDSNQTDGDFLFASRLVPLGRKGNIVYARSLRRGEEDTGEGVSLKAGEKIVIPPGELIINSREIDAYYNPAGTGGYAPVANTVWTWYQIAPEELGFFLYFFALARRTDAAHALWASAIQARDDAREAKGIPQRQGSLNALGIAEMAVIALRRCFEMVYGLVEKFSPGLQVPASVDKIRAPVRAIRHAFEHIDERAQGKINQQKTHPDALTIFNQPDFVNSSVLQYKTLTLNLETEVIAALLDCREFIMTAIDNR